MIKHSARNGKKTLIEQLAVAGLGLVARHLSATNYFSQKVQHKILTITKPSNLARYRGSDMEL